MSIKKILAAVDGSKPATHAAHKAIELAKSLKAGLTIQYIVSPPTYLDLGYANVGSMNEIESKKRSERNV